MDPTPRRSHKHMSQEGLNASHIQKEYDTQLNALKANIQEESSCFMGDQLMPQCAASMHKEFESLKYYANQMLELIKQRDNLRIVPYEQRYKIALQQTSYPDKEFEYKEFKCLEQALDNTALVDAFPQEATSFKVGILYHLRLKGLVDERTGTYSLVIRENFVTDSCKLSIEKEKISLVSGWKLAKNVYNRLMNEADESSKTAFQKSCERFERLSFLEKETVEISDRLAKLKTNSLENIDDLEAEDLATSLPKVPSSHSIETLTENKKDQLSELDDSNNRYLHFPLEGIMFNQLELGIPPHKRQTIELCYIRPTCLETFMQACLSKVEKEFDSGRLRTERNKFIIALAKIASEARQAMEDEMLGRTIDAHESYASYDAKPENSMRKIKDIYKGYQKEQEKINDCSLQGKKLTETFIAHTEKQLFSSEQKKELIDEWERFKIFLYCINDPADARLYGPSKEAKALCRVQKDKLKQTHPPEKALQTKENLIERKLKKLSATKYHKPGMLSRLLIGFS
ncbi:hypothetical protein [Candidatus Rhabdochlamydia oedothoracis]|nr:hypothetical protein [Candidatus Rhabdochlamydia oedothoracis]